jgi:NAD(P)-dependent dehydrogenase (short-subunit alcohol dehydrogenase family)
VKICGSDNCFAFQALQTSDPGIVATCKIEKTVRNDGERTNHAIRCHHRRLHRDRLGYRKAAARSRISRVRQRPQTTRRRPLANFTPLLFDVTDEAAVFAAAREVRAALGGETLFGLVNNAGIAVAGPVLELAPDESAARWMSM